MKHYCIKRYACMLMVVGVFAVCPGCTTLMDKTGQVLDGSAFAEKKVAVYRADALEIREMKNKAEEHSVVIRLHQFPAIAIRGTAPDAGGAFQLSALDYLGGNPHGWNEYRMGLFGSGSLVVDEKAAAFSIPGSIETMDISSGRIRRYDTRITGTEALASLRNRHERLLAIAEWLNSGDNPLAAGGSITSQKRFAQYWKPLLFPETARKKHRPADWQQEGDLWVKAEDIRWNTGYTARVFPEVLRGIRDSGTMLRDWEEALDWLYIEYEWERIKEQLARETQLRKL